MCVCLQSIKDNFSSLREQSDDRRQRIQAGIVAQQKLDELRLKFAKQAAVSTQYLAFMCYLHVVNRAFSPSSPPLPLLPVFPSFLSLSLADI